MLTERMQVQAVADKLGGVATTLGARNLGEPWRSCWLALEGAEKGKERWALAGALRELKERDAALGMILAAVPGAALGDFPSLQEMHDAGMIPEIRWLWRDWVPRGMLSLLTGEGGAGKSMVGLDLARRVIAGGQWPDGLEIGHGGPVVYVDAEAVPQIHDERTLWWEVDRSQLHLMLPATGELFIDMNGPACQDRLVEMVATINPALVVVDSLSTISLRGENNKEDVVALLGFLSRVATAFDLGMLLVHHLRKRGSGQLALPLTQDAVRGSGHIVAAARSVLGLSIVQTGAELNKNGPRRLEVLKTNLARYPKALGCEFVPLQPRGVMLRYGDAPQQYEAPTKADRCEDWLLETLEKAGEPMKPQEVVELAEVEGYSRAMVYRARKTLEGQVTSTEGRRSPENKWTA